ncbi:heme-degrading domain-containing protein [Trinickia sp.]|uniref:heme-degrading domain-containing protein n=1 Tax=Trinickia sp. TaxID=2571163 RepID=UPI003F7F9E7D
MNLEHDLQAITHQEHALVFPRFDAARAWKLGTFLRERAIARNHAIAIDVRTFGVPLFFCGLDGTTPDNSAWVRRKSNIVAHFRRSSYAVALRLQHTGATLADKYGLPAAEYAAAGGSFPITLAGVGAIGSVTVSGLTQRADHELVVEALCAELELDFAELALDKV